MFSGSYEDNDVQFLLKKINISSTSVEDKEQKIQKESGHYSEMITHENPPTKEYMNIFYDAVKQNGEKFSYHLWLLSKKIELDYVKEKEIVIVSLARAGTPIGVLLTKILRFYYDKKISHYSVSIIRDKGIDVNAIAHIIKKHKDTNIVFVDGWTGKGVIGEELKSSINNINKDKDTNISSNLYVVADISGTSYWSATHEDYLLPSAVLNSTVSGLVSRTILNKDYIFEGDFHGCIYYEHMKENDVSVWFINEIVKIIKNKEKNYIFVDNILSNKDELRHKSNLLLKFFMDKFNFSDRNFIKPGVGESTRVLLRRLPKEIWIKDETDTSLKHLIYLAKSKSIKVHIDSNLSYNAVSIIEELD